PSRIDSRRSTPPIASWSCTAAGSTRTALTPSSCGPAVSTRDSTSCRPGRRPRDVQGRGALAGQADSARAGRYVRTDRDARRQAALGARGRSSDEPRRRRALASCRQFRGRRQPPRARDRYGDAADSPRAGGHPVSTGPRGHEPLPMGPRRREPSCGGGDGAAPAATRLRSGQAFMRLALTLGYSGARMTLDMELVHEVERLGYDSISSPESYGSDAVTRVAWIAAWTTRLHVGTGIMQMAGRPPAATAMTAMTLDGLSGGRFRLGLGVSGPQVVEGWHGQPFGRPLRRTREYVAIVRSILRREKPLEHRGEDYQIPYAGSDATGLGKPLKSILHGRADLPIYLAAVGPKNVALAAEIADG